MAGNKKIITGSGRPVLRVAGSCVRSLATGAVALRPVR